MFKIDFRPIFVATTAATLGLATGFCPTAEAATRTRAWSVQGSRGHGYVANQTTGVIHGSATNNVTRTYNDGRTASVSGAITRNGNGSVTVDRSHTGIAGNTQTGTSTISRTDDGLSRTRSVTTSSGRSATETGNVSVAPGSMTVDRSIATGSGASVSESATYTRGD